MIVLEVEQGTLAWTQARLGIPTASQASRIVTPTGRLSKSRDGYLAQLLAEWALGEDVTDFAGTEWMERGKVLEPEARRYYAFHADAEPETVGPLSTGMSPRWRLAPPMAWLEKMDCWS